jgi:SAM-dependent methyltransferase
MAERRRLLTKRRVARVVLLGLAAGHVAEAASLRKKRLALGSLPFPGLRAVPAAGVAAAARAPVPAGVLGTSGANPDGASAVPAAVASGPNGEVAGGLPSTSPAVPATVAVPPGARLDDATREAAAAELAASGARVLDLVPADMPVERALWLLRRIDPERLGTDPAYAPGGAHEALVLHPDVVAKLEAAGTGAGAGTEPADRGAMERLTVRAQRYEPAEGRVAVRVAPVLRAAPAGPRDRWRELEEMTALTRPYASLAPLVLGAETAYLAVLTGGVLVAPVAAALALGTWMLQPVAVFGGEAAGGGPSLAPPGLATSSLLRLPRVWADNLRTAAAGLREVRSRDAARAADPEPLPDVDALFEARRSTCPWCDSGSLTDRLDITDLLQHKPGAFHLDECRDCGHVFQNPALTIEGLDHYYKDAYDGAGDELAEVSFGSLTPIYERRVETLARFAEPRAWLDVGTGHGHFPVAARKRWPEARFDGLDLSDTVEEAERRGRIETGYRGLFPELADGLPRSYDVLSMHHYLEHTREPRAELAAAAKVLEPGGHLMIEMPDAESPWARRLGTLWWQWAQPQHQHFIPCDELVAALEQGGFEVVSVERGQATMGGELFNAVALGIQTATRSPNLPWLPPVPPSRRLTRIAALLAALPAFAVTKVWDNAKDARLRRPDSTTPGNAYRIVARRI